MTCKTTLVLAEDHDVTMQGLFFWFRQSNDFEVLGKTSNKDEVLSLIQQHKPEILLLDLHLEGTKRLRQVIQEVVATGTKIIVFSSENRLFYVNLALESGVSGFLLKSENFSTVSDVVSRVKHGQTGILSEGLNARSCLTPAEDDILQLLASGMKYEQIANIRLTTKETIRKQCDKMLIKLGLSSREQMISWAARNGFCSNEEVHL